MNIQQKTVKDLENAIKYMADKTGTAMIKAALFNDKEFKDEFDTLMLIGITLSTFLEIYKTNNKEHLEKVETKEQPIAKDNVVDFGKKMH